MNPGLILRHIAKDAGEIAAKLTAGRFHPARCAAQTHAYNARNLVANRTLAPRVQCPCCQWRGYAFRAVDGERTVFLNVECPRCLAYERQRFLSLYLSRHGSPFSEQGRLLHVAPEPQLIEAIRGLGGHSIFGLDIAPEKLKPLRPRAFRTDLHRMSLPDDCFDGALCLHVLEHVGDDRRAVAELHRVLKPGATLLLMVPLGMHLERTVEHPPGTPLLFGHVRDYSPKDLVSRWRPFDVQEVRPHVFLSPEEQRRFAVPDHEILYRCKK